MKQYKLYLDPVTNDLVIVNHKLERLFMITICIILRRQPILIAESDILSDLQVTSIEFEMNHLS